MYTYNIYIYVPITYIYCRYMEDVSGLRTTCCVSLSLSVHPQPYSVPHTHTQTGFFTVYCTRFHCCCVPPRERESVIVSLNWCDEDSERFIFCPRGKIIQERKINFPGA